MRKIARGFCFAASVLLSGGCVGTRPAEPVAVPLLGASRPHMPSGGEGLVMRDLLTLETTEDELFTLALEAENPNFIRPNVADTLGLSAIAASGLTGRPLAGHRLTDRLPYAYGGNSGGLMLALAVACALEGRPLPTDFSATGSVLPEGTVAPVEEMSVKIAAAAKAGFRRVAVPTVPETETLDGRTVEPVAWGREHGVEVRRVKTLAEAYAWLTGEEERTPPVDERQALSLPDDVKALLARQMTNRLEQAVAWGAKPEMGTAVRAEFEAGRIFHARQLAQCAQAFQAMLSGRELPPPPEDMKDPAIEPWLSVGAFGIEEKVRQDAEQGAPQEETAAMRNLMRWQRFLEAEDAREFAKTVADGTDESPAALAQLNAIADAESRFFEEDVVEKISEKMDISSESARQLLYRESDDLLTGSLVMSLVGCSKMMRTRSRLAWLAANQEAVSARFGGKLKIEKDAADGKLTFRYGFGQYIGLFADEARRSALRAIASVRASGRLPGPALLAFEDGEWRRGLKAADKSHLLAAYESYLYALWLCRPATTSLPR